ncbi:uncharacterized protein LOC133901177 [Phragmites australis]|uniref:uncharacterized protein LOC133901177 n=1 Tax=Phragmites australis TaxID=29695 RepID=UPI002D798F35|nr:uncharacterized protein LOC133901177 [Phragmites australis]
MEGGGGGEVVELEDAVKLLVEHLVLPVLPRGALRGEEALAPEKQETVARQMHAAVLLYNYYHRKQFPQLDFADPKRFCMSASLVARDALLVYLNQVHERRKGAVGDAGAALSVTDRAVMDACHIAKALDATQDSPEMTMWPISKVAVLLLDRTKKRCLIEHGPMTKGVWSIVEKEIKTASSSDMSVQGSSNKEIPLPSEPYVLQQIAYAEVELKTGMKRPNLRFLEEHLVYSLSKKETTTKLIVVQYEQTVNDKLKEMPLEDLIGRMSGPIFKSVPYPITTSVVECYHLLPYKEVLLNLLNREWPLDSSHSEPKEQSLHNEKSEIDESLKEQEANSKSKMKKTTTNVSTPKKNKQVAKAVGNSGINNCNTSKNRKNSNMNSKRKSVTATPATLAVPAAETLKSVSNSVSAKATRETSEEFVDLKASVQVDKTEKHSDSRNTPRDIFTVKAPEVDLVLKDHALESQTEKVTEKSGGITNNMDDQMYVSLQSLQRMRDDILHNHCMLGDQSAQCDMDIQTILTEGAMTPRVMSILERYENSSSNKVANSTCSGEGRQTMNMKRKRLTEAILLRNKCQELDEICRENNWILPRYKVLPSVTDEMYKASVYLMCPDFDMSVDGDMKVTPREARNSAASKMLYKLHQKATENVAEQDSSAPDAMLAD